MTAEPGTTRPHTRRRWLKGMATLLSAAPFAACAQQSAAPADEHWLEAGGGRLRVFTGPGEFVTPMAELYDWVGRSARLVAGYYGRFPVPEAYCGLFPVDGVRVRTGKAFPFRVPTINVSVGREATRAALDDDWVLVHEMVHLAFPSVARRHHWIEEGLATYVEPVARARGGNRSPDSVWLEFTRGMPKGLPGPGDRGIDRTPTWGRTYWGGALFCLQADVGYQRASNGRVGLREALRGILDAGLGMHMSAELGPTLDIADEAAGVAVLRPLYERWRETAVDVDLPALWASLGVSVTGEAVQLHDDAPLAAVRRRICG